MAPKKEPAGKKGKEAPMSPKPTGEAKRLPKEPIPVENAKTPQEIMAERRLQELRKKVRKQVSSAVIQYPLVGRNMKFEIMDREEQIFLRIYSDGRFLFRRPAAAGVTEGTTPLPPKQTSSSGEDWSVRLVDTIEGVMRNSKEWEEYLEGVTDADSTAAEIDLQAMLRITEAWPKAPTYSVEDAEEGRVPPAGPARRIKTVAVEEVFDVIHLAIVPFFKPEYAVLWEDGPSARRKPSDTVLGGPRKGSRVPPARLQMGLTVTAFAGEEPESAVWMPCTGADACLPGPGPTSKQKGPSPSKMEMQQGARRLAQSMSMGALETTGKGRMMAGTGGVFDSSPQPRKQQGQLPRLNLLPQMGQSASGLGAASSTTAFGRLADEKRRHQNFFGKNAIGLGFGLGASAMDVTHQKDLFLSTVIDSLRPGVPPGNQLLLRKTFSSPDLTEQLSILKPMDAKRGPGGDNRQRGPKASFVGSAGGLVPGLGAAGGGVFGGAQAGGMGAGAGYGNQHARQQQQFPLAPAGSGGAMQQKQLGAGTGGDWSTFYKSRTEEFFRKLHAG